MLWPQFVQSLQCMSLGIWSWWAMDVFTVIASYMTPADILTGQTIMRNITMLTFTIPVGIMISSTVFVGNFVGANKIPTAKAYAKTCVKSAAIWGLATIVLLQLLQTQFIGIFTNDDIVKGIIFEAYPIIMLYVLFDCIQSVGMGIIRGLGRQGAASIGAVIGYWVIGVPFAWLAVFKLEWGIRGLWLGPTLAIMFNFIYFYSLVIRTDWDKVAA